MGSVSIVQIVVAVIASFAGSTIFSTVGFGIGMVAMPILLLVLDPQTAVVVLNSVEVPLAGLMVWQNRSHLKTKEMTSIAIAGLIGALVGAFLLASANENPLRISILVLIMALALVTVFNSSGFSMPTPSIAGPLVGFIVGVILTSLAIGGPLLVLFIFTRNWDRHAVRSSLSLYFLFVMPTAVIGYAVGGLYTPDRVILTIITLAPVLIGFWLGSKLAQIMDERMFKTAAIMVILVTSTAVLIREVSQVY